jgi:hypothetical protein
VLPHRHLLNEPQQHELHRGVSRATAGFAVKAALGRRV